VASIPEPAPIGAGPGSVQEMAARAARTPRSLASRWGDPNMADQKKRPKPAESEEEVVLLKDLAPREEVKGGAKLRFGEPPSSSSKLHRR
jgi:hypothetical protein